MLARLQRIIGFLIGTNVYIAAVAACMAAPGLLVFNPQYFYLNLFFVLASTMLAYNLQRYFKWRTGNMPVFLYDYAFSHRTWMLLIVPLCLVCAALFFFMRPFHQLLVAGITGITGLYLFIHPTSGKLTGLRFIPFAKTLVVAFCWTALFMVVCVGTAAQTLPFIRYAWPYWLLVFVQVWQSCVLFDLRDVDTDRRHGVKTFANTLGKQTLMGLWAAMGLAVLYMSFWPGRPHYVYALALYLLGLALQLFCLLRPQTNGIVFTFLLDGSLVPMAAGNFLLLLH